MGGYEAAISKAGEWGRWQWRMLLVMMSPAMVASMATLSWIFTAQPVPCDSPGEQHQSILIDLALNCGEEKERWLTSLLAPVFMVGMLVGAPVMGGLSDRYGRLPAILLSLSVTTMAGSLLPALPPLLASHFTLRFITGFGSGGVLVGNFVYLVEWSSSHNYWRLISALGLHLGWNLGQLCLVGCSTLLSDWRILQVTTHLAGIPVIFILLTQQESVRSGLSLSSLLNPLLCRWLLNCGRLDKAIEILSQGYLQDRKEHFISSLSLIAYEIT